MLGLNLIQLIERGPVVQLFLNICTDTVSVQNFKIIEQPKRVLWRNKIAKEPNSTYIPEGIPKLQVLPWYDSSGVLPEIKRLSKCGRLDKLTSRFRGMIALSLGWPIMDK